MSQARRAQPVDGRVLSRRFKELSLRRYKKGDEESLQKHANNKNIAKNLRDMFPSPYRMEDAVRWIELQSKCPDPFELKDIGGAAPSKLIAASICVDDAVVGGVGIVLRDDVDRYSVDIGYWLGEAFWKKGYMTEAIGMAVDFIFEQYASVNRIQACIYAFNQASEKVLVRNGFQLEGRLRQAYFKDGVFVDGLMFSQLRSDWQKKSATDDKSLQKKS